MNIAHTLNVVRGPCTIQIVALKIVYLCFVASNELGMDKSFPITTTSGQVQYEMREGQKYADLPYIRYMKSLKFKGNVEVARGNLSDSSKTSRRSFPISKHREELKIRGNAEHFLTTCLRVFELTSQVYQYFPRKSWRKLAQFMSFLPPLSNYHAEY